MNDINQPSKDSRGVSRRRFIAGTGSILGAVSLAGRAVAAPAPTVTAAASIPSGAHVPVLVVGTGYGGSVAALRLAQAGVGTQPLVQSFAERRRGEQVAEFRGLLEQVVAGDEDRCVLLPCGHAVIRPWQRGHPTVQMPHRVGRKAGQRSQLNGGVRPGMRSIPRRISNGWM